MKCIFLIYFFIGFCAESFSQAEWKTPKYYTTIINPVEYSDQSVNSGKLIYQKNCSSCHGKNGMGNGIVSSSLNVKPADHTSEKFQNQKDGEIYWKIKTGRGAMPGWNNSLQQHEIWNIVNFIRSLNPNHNVISHTTTVKSNDPFFYTPEQIADSGLTRRADSLEKYILSSLIILNKKSDSLFLENEFLKSEIEKKSNEGERRFLATGSANSLLKIKSDSWDEFGFTTGVLPLFLWMPSKKLLFETHFHVEAHGGISDHAHENTSANSYYSEASISLQSANLSYFINRYITVNAGYFPSPFGIFNERLHPDWINKFSDSPLGSGHELTVGPTTEMGFQLRGGCKVKKTHINYSAYISNGPQLDYSSENAGKLLFGSFSDNNLNKAVGGRIGFLPFINSTLEFGVSSQFAKVGDKGTMYENLSAQMYSSDLSFNLMSKKLSGNFSFKSQFSFVSLGNASYTVIPDARFTSPSVFHSGSDTITYYFINESHAGFAFISYRPAFIENKFLNNIEICCRFDEIQFPSGSLWEITDKRYTIGINYWIAPRSVIKVDYEIGEYADFAMIQFVIGF